MTVTDKGFAFTGIYHRGGDNRLLVVSCDPDGNVPDHGNQLQINTVEFIVETPVLGFQDKTAGTVFENTAPVVSDTNSKIYELSPERRRH